MRFKENLENPNNTDALKLIAILTMVIDHIGKVFFPHIILLRIIGRVSFPIFAYLIALGYNRTSSYKRYLKRLVIFAVISIIPYYYFSDGFNVFFTLAFGLIAIHFFKKGNYVIPLGVIVLAESFHASYGWYGVLMILLFNVLMDKPDKLILSVVCISLIQSLVNHNTIQLYSLFSLFLLSVDFKEIEIKLPRYTFYWFYPIHIALFLILKRFI